MKQDRNTHVELLASPYLKEVQVEDDGSRRVTLYLADQDLRGSGTFDTKIDDRVLGVDRCQQQVQLVCVDRKGPVIYSVPVRHRRNFARRPQLARDALP